MSAAESAVETIQREMTVFARRARASAGRMHPELSLVSYTLLGHLEEIGLLGDLPSAHRGDARILACARDVADFRRDGHRRR